MSFLQSMRQLQYPREFRIDKSSVAGESPPPQELLSRIESLLGKVDVEPAGDDREMIRKLANEVWKLDGRVNKLELKDPDLVRGLKPVLVSLRDMLKEREVEFVDRTGHEFDPDELWDDVVGAQSSAGSAVITKMVRPRIMYRGSLLQRGVCQVESKE